MRWTQLLAGDLRRTLPRADWTMPARPGDPRSVTAHYNGPAVANFGDPEAELRQLAGDARWQMRPGGLGAANGGDGLQYHFAILSDGRIFQCRDIETTLWHCRNDEGNTWSISTHLVLGGTQEPTAAQWDAFTQFAEALIADYRMNGRKAVRGHREWSTTACPGPAIWRRLVDWRAQTAGQPTPAKPEAPGLRYYRTIAEANVREGPSTRYPIALDGKAVLPAGTIYEADAVTWGDPAGSDRQWLHAIPGIGFIHNSLLQRIDESTGQLTFLVTNQRISAAQFKRVLQHASSPVCAEADLDELAAIPERYGVCRGVALAFFRHESSCGKAGITLKHQTKNWGNVRAPYRAERATIIVPPGRGPFAKYMRWEDGLIDWCERIKHRYAGERDLWTVELATPVYAPSDDSNDPMAYAAAVQRDVAAWRAEDRP